MEMLDPKPAPVHPGLPQAAVEATSAPADLGVPDDDVPF